MGSASTMPVVCVVPIMVPKDKAFWMLCAFTASLIVLLGVVCLYTHGRWFWIASSATLFGLSVVFLPFAIRAEPVKNHGAAPAEELRAQRVHVVAAVYGAGPDRAALQLVQPTSLVAAGQTRGVRQRAQHVARDGLGGDEPLQPADADAAAARAARPDRTQREVGAVGKAPAQGIGAYRRARARGGTRMIRHIRGWFFSEKTG